MCVPVTIIEIGPIFRSESGGRSIRQSARRAYHNSILETTGSTQDAGLRYAPKFEQLAEHLRDEKLEGDGRKQRPSFPHALTAQFFNPRDCRQNRCSTTIRTSRSKPGARTSADRTVTKRNPAEVFQIWLRRSVSTTMRVWQAGLWRGYAAIDEAFSDVVAVASETAVVRTVYELSHPSVDRRLDASWVCGGGIAGNRAPPDIGSRPSRSRAVRSHYTAPASNPFRGKR
ncbi:hypothetical protein NKH52_15795 [Mesorhizobium sp. M1066]|uniref:hypothetical protein n=1 Tax=unclassified Mesorhizobium TaxID=325217 RepID=UPI00333D45BE